MISRTPENSFDSAGSRSRLIFFLALPESISMPLGKGASRVLLTSQAALRFSLFPNPTLLHRNLPPAACATLPTWRKSGRRRVTDEVRAVGRHANPEAQDLDHSCSGVADAG